MKSIYIRCYFQFSLLLSLNVTAQPGSLDITFGNAGKVITNNGWQSVTGTTCLMQPDGKIVVGGAGYDGTLNYGWTLYRFQPNGSTDASFAGDGCIDEDFIGTSWVINIALQTDQKVVELGYWGIKSLIKRWDTDGTIDITFGYGGEILCDDLGEFNAMEILQDDRIILAGKSYSSQTYGSAVVCLDEYGNLDPSFGNGGICAIPDTSIDLLFYSALQSDDKIMVLGHNYDGNSFLIARINTDGVIDSTFGLNGILTYQFWSGYLAPFAMITDPADNILISGAITATIDQNPFLIRLTPDGLCDSSFNQNGFLSISYGTESFERWGAIVVEEDKKILVGGFSEDSLLLCSFRDDGSIDSAFGNYGKVKDYFGGYGTGIADICIQDDAKVVAVGRGNNSHMVLRYNTAFSIGLNEPKSEIVSFNIYPNPLQNQATLDYTLKTGTEVSVSLLNILGQTVDVFIDGKMMEAGSNSETLSFYSNYLPGMYFVRITCGGDTKLIKCEIY